MAGLASSVGIVGFASAIASPFYECSKVNNNKDHWHIKAAKLVQDRMSLDEGAQATKTVAIQEQALLLIDGIEFRVPDYVQTPKEHVIYKDLIVKELEKSDSNKFTQRCIWSWLNPVIFGALTIVVTICIDQYLGKLGIRSEAVAATAAFAGVIGFAGACNSGVSAVFKYFADTDNHDIEITEHVKIRAAKAAQDRFIKEKWISNEYSEKEIHLSTFFRIAESNIITPTYARSCQKRINYEAFTLEEFQKAEFNNAKKRFVWNWLLPIILIAGTTCAVISASVYLHQIGLGQKVIAGIASSTGIAGLTLGIASGVFMAHRGIEKKEDILARVARIVQNKYSQPVEA